MVDPTENSREEIAYYINKNPRERKELEEEFGQVWSTKEMFEDFIVISFLSPFVVVIRRSDRIMGSLMFQHLPRFYFNFLEDIGEQKGEKE